MKLTNIVITTGDLDGIGLEVTTKALLQIKNRSNIHFFVFLSSLAKKSHVSKHLRLLKKKYRLVSSNTLDSALALAEKSVASRKNGCSISYKSKPPLFLIKSPLRPALWVEIAARSCLSGQSHAMVTASLSKPEIIRAGLRDIGHTEILKRLCFSKTAKMTFAGNFFSVLIASGHIPLKKVETALTNYELERAIMLAHNFVKLLFPKEKRPVGILGLNPHAGDSSLIGNFEESRLLPLIKKLRRRGYFLSGPLVPDVAFQKNIRKKFSIFVAMYHDQGLIPFKMQHGIAGAHLTLGLPIWRTSVDHGTAKDLFDLDLADPKSMLDAIKWSIKLSKLKPLKTTSEGENV